MELCLTWSEVVPPDPVPPSVEEDDLLWPSWEAPRSVPPPGEPAMSGLQPSAASGEDDGWTVEVETSPEVAKWLSGSPVSSRPP